MALKVEVLSGRACIGGNFVRVEDGDRVLIFDQGIRFDVLGRYYSGYIAPTGLHELREIGAVPRAEWYAGASAIYISHMHLDHLGLLANIPSKVDAFLPSLSLYEAMEEKWWGSPTWLSMVPHKYYVRLEEARPLEADRNNVMALPVSHSAFPAYAFLYFGSDETLLYTGDFRVEGFCLQGLSRGMPLMLEYLRENRDIRVDRLIVEGTNLGSFRPPISPSEEEAMLNRILAGHSLAVATIHPLDAEYALFLSEKAAEHGRPLYIASSEAAKLLDGLGEKPTEAAVLVSYVNIPTRFDIKEADAVEGNALIITSYREVLTLLRELGDVLPPNATVILSEPEPQVEEAQEYGALMNWFARLGVQAYAMRVSGHYYPCQLHEILESIKPKTVELVHSNQIKIPLCFGEALSPLQL